MNKEDMLLAMMLSCADENCSIALTPEQMQKATEFIDNNNNDEPLDVRLYGIRIVETE